VADAIALYDEAWNAADPATRAHLLEQSLTPDAELIDPTAGRIQGRDAIAERIGGFVERFPGARVAITSEIDEHNGFARYVWTISDADGQTLGEGLDLVERTTDGLIKRVVMFFDQH
jgi:ketosteroid isomerase-like protein